MALPSTKELRTNLFNEISKTLKRQVEDDNAKKPNYKDKSVLIYDYGTLTEFAVRLARDFGKVYYYCHWESHLPKSNLALIGDGLENVERIDDFWAHVDKVDLICFFDTYSEDMVEYLRGKGYRVWGAGKSELLETDRKKSRKIQEAIGLPTQNTQFIKGIEQLNEYLKVNEDKWIKINQFRGDIETFHHDKYDETSAQFLGKIMSDFGAKGKTMEFLVEDSIGEVEPGLDTWCIDGQYPEVAMYGYENKDQSYLGRTSTFANIPGPVKSIAEQLKPVMKKLGGRTFFSTELRVDKKGVGYLIDPTIRVPLPPSGVHLEMWKNFSDIVWYGAGGELVKPVANAVYGAEILFTSDWAADNWTFIDFPKEIRQWVKLRMAFCTPDHKYYAVPGETFIGSVVGLGNTPQEAMDKAKSRISQIHAKDLDYNVESLEKIAEDMVLKGRKLGIKF